MPMVEAAAVTAAIGKLQAAGFDTTNPLFKGDVMVTAIVEAVIAEVRKGTITGLVTGGGSSGGQPTASTIS